MGFLPLFVALFGLILLYSIYTYNQIKPRKAQLTRVIDLMAENSRNRKQIVLQFDDQNPESEIKDLAEKLKKTSTDRFQSYKKEEEFIAEFDNCIIELKHNEIASELKALNLKQQEMLKSLKAKAYEYNRFIQKSPASVVASVFGFRQF